MKNSEYQNLRYVGSFATLQTKGNSQYMQQTAVSFSKRQNELYSRLLRGLKCYNKSELYAMNSKKKNKIDKSHKEAQRLLNIWKQEQMVAISSDIFDKYDLKQTTIENPKSSKIKDKKHVSVKLSEMFKEVDEHFRCTLTFKDLGLNKGILANKFIESELLPQDFMVL